MKFYRLRNDPTTWLVLALVLIISDLILNPALVRGQSPPGIQSTPADKSILLFYSAGFHLPAYRKNMAAFMSVMEKASFPAGNVFFENLDLARHGNPEYRLHLNDVIHQKYRDRKIDLLITIEGAARDFVLNDCRDLFPVASILAILSADTVKPGTSPRRMVQIPTIPDMAGTLKAALSLFPKTKHIFVVLGDGADERRWELEAKRQFAPWIGSLDFTISSNLTYEETLQRITSLPPETVVIYLAFYHDKTGRAFVPAEVAGAVAKTSKVPVFGVYDQILDLVVGGSMISYETEGARAAQLALDIVNGKFSFREPSTTLPVLSAPKFNWRQLHRWGVSQSRLPKGSLVFNRPASIWNEYKGYVIGFVIISVLQAGLIVSLLVMRRRRIKAELNRQLAEEGYRRIVELANEGIWVIDNALRTTFVNQKMADMLGYAPEELIGQVVDGFIYPEDLEAHKHSMEKRRRGLNEEYERRWVRKDGEAIWVRVRATPLFDEQGQFSGSFAMFTDITERKRTEEALRHNEEKFSKAFKISPDAININRLSDGLYLDINEGFTRITGYTLEDVIGRSSLPGDLGIWVRREDRDRLVASLEATGEAIGLEAPFRRKDGTVLTGLMSARSLEISGEECILSVTRDITERKEAEEALRKSRERYRNILESIEEGYYEVDGAGNFTFFNDLLCDMVGYTREELMGMNYRHYTDEENADRLFAAYNEVYRTGTPTKGFAYQVIRKDGTVGFAEVSVSPIQDADGNITGFRGIARDITDRKRAEEEKEKLERQLQQARKMEAIGTLAGGIAHDFNNILMGIQGRASLMVGDIGPAHPFFEHLKGIETYVKNAADLTKQLLGFARAGMYEVQPTDLNALVDQSAHLFGRTKKEISLHRKLQPALWTVEVDRGQIEQVLLNLFVNAWQAMPAGGDLYLETRNVILDEQYLRSHALKPGRFVRISVTDTGSGMDEATRHRIFDPFFTTKEMGRGTGLGLASAYGTIKHHQGIINVYSEKGHGTTFTIYLPASEKEVPMEKQPPAHIDRGSGTVLLVDDEEMILEVSRRMLEKIGYKVKTARGGEEALKILSEAGSEIRLVILDMIMPGLSGSETFERLKAEHPGIQVLLSSGYSLNGQAQHILNKGCVGFIQKPFSLSELSQRLGKILGSV